MLRTLLFYTLMAGSTIFIGALAANYFNHHVEESPVRAEITHFMMSFGGGLILSVLALLFIPRSLDVLSTPIILLLFLLGTILFSFLDYYLEKNAENMSLLVIMLMSFFPKSIILGALLVTDPSLALVLAIFMGIQNFPESFNAFRNMILGGYKKGKMYLLFFGLSLLGVIGGLIGYFFLHDKPHIVAELMIFFSGGIVYLMFQDIAPDSKLEGSYISSLGATFGFMLGMIVESMM